MEIALRALGLDVLPVDADAQVDQAFRLSVSFAILVQAFLCAPVSPSWLPRQGHTPAKTGSASTGAGACRLKEPAPRGSHWP